MALSANKILERNPTEIDWWVHGDCWVPMLGFAPASLHPTYELLIYGEIASVAGAPLYDKSFVIVRNETISFLRYRQIPEGMFTL